MDALVSQIIEIASQEWVRDIFWTVILGTATFGVSHIVVKGLRALLNRDSNPLPSSSIIVNIARAVIWIIGGSIILDSCFGINPNALITALGVGGIAISLGFQDTLSNLIGGIQVTFMGIVRPGDNIDVGGDAGVVEDVGWRHTTITNNRGERVIIPNSIISKTALVHLPPVNQIAIPFAVTDDSRSMDDVADELARVSKAAAEDVSPVIQDP
ncbi:MAG: mechanosensitive ion channel family protein, partial [Slackia sp.]